MDIELVREPFPYLRIRGFYTPEERTLVWQELDFLTHKDKLNPPAQTGQKNPDMKKNRGLFLDEVYVRREFSNILKLNRKAFSFEVMKAYASLHFSCESILSCDHDTTLVSYYEERDHYRPHRDKAVVTALTWMFREPAAFRGGEISFPAYDLTLPVESNTFVLFPSCIEHAVAPVTMPPGYTPFGGAGRYCISQFMSVR
jgi:predicted 2-oxoglutarate/Fe(II)-dependent dioxygenase YbiX